MCAGGNWLMFLSHIDVSLSLFLPLSLKINKHILGWGFKKNFFPLLIDCFSFHPLPLRPLWQPSACSQYLWVCFYFVHLFCFVFRIPRISEIIWYLSFSDLFHLEWCPLGPSMLCQMARFHSFLLLNNIPFQWLSRKSPAIVNMMKMVSMTSMW